MQMGLIYFTDQVVIQMIGNITCLFFPFSYFPFFLPFLFVFVPLHFLILLSIPPSQTQNDGLPLH